MRLLFILDETRFYQPNFLARFLERTKDEVVGVGLVTKIPRKHSLELYLAKHFYYLRPGEILKLLTRRCVYAVRDRFGAREAGGPFFSVESVCQFHRLAYFPIRRHVNSPEYLAQIASFKPDVIVSSNSLVFKEPLLHLPPKGCINRHSGLLPAYGGLWPVFHAVRHGEDCVGVSIHTMTRKIDQGIILSQVTIPVKPDDTIADLYAVCFEKSVDALLMALEKIAQNDLSAVQNALPPSYFSFPSGADWRELRARKRKFI